MNVYLNPPRSEWPAICRRPQFDNTELEASVRAILQDVKSHGDAAVGRYSETFDQLSPDAPVEISKEEMAGAEGLISDELKAAINLAADNIRRFHQTQVSTTAPIETTPGVSCWRKVVPIDKVGLYIPGGTAPLFSTVLMLGVPAKLAGCPEILLCTPPSRETGSPVHPAVLYAAGIVGVDRVFRVGGVQAIAAMAYGTSSIPAVYKIFGPGNQYVNAAKQLVQLDGVAIDMPAGPSEVCVIADETADASFVAADLLSQAEHGPDSQVLLLCTGEQFLSDVQSQLAEQLKALPRADISKKALSNSNAVVFDSIDQALALANAYAPEHLIIACGNANSLAERVADAGSVFIGNYSPESVGDYASGTNHVLPTNGFARAYSGVSVDSFVKKITFQQLSYEGLNGIAAAVEAMAAAEGLAAHRNAVSIRLLNKNK